MADERDEAKAAIASLRATYAHVHADAEAQRAALTAVKRGESRSCPSCNRPFEGGDVQGFLDHLAQQVHASDAEAAEIEREGTRARKHLDDVERRLATAEEQAEQLRQNQAKVQAVLGLIAATDEQAREARGAHPGRSKSASACSWASKRNCDALATRGRPARRCGHRPTPWQASSRRCTQYRERLDGFSAQRRQAAGRLSRYDGLDARLGQARRDREACRDGFDIYRRFAPLAAELPAREHAVADARLAAAEAGRLCGEAAAQHRQLASAYDATAHQDVRDRERRVEVDAAAERSRLSGITQQLTDGREQRDRLRTVQTQAARPPRAWPHPRPPSPLSWWCAMPYAWPGRRSPGGCSLRASSAANRMFSEMMGDFAIELNWGHDYGITLRRGADTARLRPALGRRTDDGGPGRAARAPARDHRTSAWPSSMSRR